MKPLTPIDTAELDEAIESLRDSICGDCGEVVELGYCAYCNNYTEDRVSPDIPPVRNRQFVRGVGEDLIEVTEFDGGASRRRRYTLTLTRTVGPFTLDQADDYRERMARLEGVERVEMEPVDV